MKTELLGQEKNVVKVKVEFEAEEFTQGLKKALKDLSQQVNIPGFRKGHAPRKIMEMRFGRGALYEEALEKLVDVRQIIDDYELDTIERPRLDVDFSAIHEGEPVACELIFEVMPEVELPDIENIEVEKLRANVTEEMVDRLIRQVRKENAEIKAVERPVEDNDLVSVELSVQVVGMEGNVEAPHKDQIDLFDENTRKEFRDALLGKNRGDHVEAEFDVEPDHQNRAFAGKRLRYIMKVENVSEYILPELNEDFYQKLFGVETDIHTEEDFRNKMRKDFEVALDKDNSNDAEYRALMTIVRQAKLEVPESMIARQTQALRRSHEEEARERYGIELSEILGRGNKDWERDYIAVQRTRAEAMVRQSLVVDAIAKKYEVEVEKEDVDAEITRRAKLYKVDKNSLTAYYYRNEDAMDKLVDDLRYSKTTALLLTKVKVREVDELTPAPEPAPSQEQAQPEQTEQGEQQ